MTISNPLKAKLPFQPDGLGSDPVPPDPFGQNGYFSWIPTTILSDGSSATMSPWSDSRGGNTSGSTTTTTTSPGTTTSSTSSFVINISWDSSVSSAPAAFKTAVQNAVTYLESLFSDPVTVNISVGYGEVNGTPLGSNQLGASYYWLNSYGYSTLYNALKADATTATDSAAVASLPSSSPVNGTFWATTAQSKALGLTSATSTATDGYVGFSSSLPFTYDNTNGVASGTYDFNGTALHELTEVLGRTLLVGGSIGTTANSYYIEDLFHYSSAGLRTFSGSTAGYFSVDGGQTSLGTFNTNSGGDYGDWASSMGNDAFNAFSNAGVINAMTATDASVLDAIGWNLAGTSTTTTSPTTPTGTAPTGVSFAPAVASLATVGGGSGLSANAAIAAVSQVGGTSGDSFGYTLGGVGAASFTLTTANNAATLAVGSGGAAGSSGGTLYALTVTAKDLTNGLSAPATAVNVVVGSGGNDSITISPLVGSSGAAAPTFVFGNAGADTLNASGMTGTVWFDGGAGADTFTGGSGPNVYEYAAASDSTAASMDIITNFHAASDLIDLRGLGMSLSIGGAIKNAKKPVSLAPHSVNWQVSGGNTYVYINTGGSSETLASADMKIQLNGSISLTSGMFLHN